MSGKISLHWNLNSIKDKKEKEELERTISNVLQGHVFGLLRDIIDKDLSSLEGQILKQDIYENPNWMHRQAHNNGKLEVLKKLRDMLRIERK